MNREKEARAGGSDSGRHGCSVGGVVESVWAKVLTQMDGRDLVRCWATEELCGVDVFCVSQEQGALYRAERHLEADFNHRNFVRDLEDHFGSRCHFDQIVLDYFWIPRGWDESHWKPLFFTNTLPAFAATGLLNTSSNWSHREGRCRRESVVYLPCSIHCLREVAVAFDKLRVYYCISFLRKDELGEICLWAGTQSLDKSTMMSVFGKELSQEEIYCTVTQQQLRSMNDDPRITKTAFLEFVGRLGDVSTVRFIALELLTVRQEPRAGVGGVVTVPANGGRSELKTEAACEKCPKGV